MNLTSTFGVFSHEYSEVKKEKRKKDDMQISLYWEDMQIESQTF